MAKARTYKRDSKGRFAGGGGGGRERGGKPVGSFMQRQKSKLQQSQRDKAFSSKATAGRSAKAAYKAKASDARTAARRAPSAAQQQRSRQFSSKAKISDRGSDARYLYKLQSGAVRKAKKEGRLTDSKINQAGVDRTVRNFGAPSAATKSKQTTKAQRQRGERLMELQGAQRRRNWENSPQGKQWAAASAKLKRQENSPAARAGRAISRAKSSAGRAARGIARRVGRSLR